MRKPYCNPKVPTFAIDRRLGNVHVGTPPTDVEAMIREAIGTQQSSNQAGEWTPAIQAQTVRYALWRHAKNLEEYRWVMGSHK